MDTKISNLVANIKKHNEAYRQGTPIVSDIEYDQEIEQLRQLDPNNEWFQHIEPAPVKNTRKVRLPIPMKSLDKVKSTEELQKWFDSMALRTNCEMVITPKFDGLSLLHNELTGMAYSRGGAENEGQDCTAHYDKAGFGDKASELHYTYGELVFSCQSWADNFAGQISPETGNKYKSPRNTAAGLLNRDQPSPLLRHLDFYRYGADETSIHQFSSYADFYEYTCNIFKQPKLYKVVSVADINEDLLHQLFDDWSKQYFIDGLVLYFNELSTWDKLGRQKTTGNPNYAIAYKNPSFTEVFETTVLGVSWAISKAGAFKPVVKIDMIDTGDCEMENPTGFNARYIKERAIAPGAVVKVTRSGGVIPTILEVTAPAPKENVEAMWDELGACPHCGTSLCWNESQVDLICPNANCDGTRLAKLVFFYEKAGAEGMGPETIARIYDAGFKTLREMLDITFEELLLIDSIGEDTANIVLQNNSRIRKGLDVTVLMHASSCFPGIGQVKAQQLLDKMTEGNRFAFVMGILELPAPDVMHSQKFYLKANKTEQSFYDNVGNFYSFLADNRLVVNPLKEKKPTSDKYAGFRVCFTGIRDKLLEEQITDGGGTIANSVSNKTTHLIVASHDSQSGKAKRAALVGIPILTIEEFKAL